jgi:hypothetical protein
MVVGIYNILLLGIIRKRSRRGGMKKRRKKMK